jgi:hypothetical protein
MIRGRRRGSQPCQQDQHAEDGPESLLHLTPLSGVTAGGW